MTPASPPDHLDGRTTGLAALGVGTVGLVIATVTWPFARTADDSLFYLQIARNVVAGRGITFDGITPTNGFQPLWQLAMTPVVGAMDAVGITGEVGQLRGIVVLCWVLTLLTGWRLDRLLADLDVSPRSRLVALAVLLGYLGGPLALMGSEAYPTALLLVVSLTLMARLTSQEQWGTRLPSLLGLTFGLLLLARLDTVFTVGALVGTLSLSSSQPVRERVRTVAVVVGFGSVVVAPYLVANLVAFGRIDPISGALKVDLTRPHLLWSALGIGWIPLLGAVGASIAAYTGRRHRPPTRPLVAALGIGSSLAAAYYVVGAQRPQTDWGWYFVPSVLALAVAGADTAERWVDSASARVPRRPRPLRARAVDAVALAAAAIMLVVAVWVPRSAAQRYAAATAAFSRRLSEVVPAHERIAVVDLPGILAVAGDRGIVAVDGLTQDWQFQSDLNDLGVTCALQRRGVGHLVTYTEPLDSADPDRRRPTSWTATSWLTDQRVGTIVLDPDQRVVDADVPGLTLWRLRPADC